MASVLVYLATMLFIVFFYVYFILKKSRHSFYCFGIEFYLTPS